MNRVVLVVALMIVLVCGAFALGRDDAINDAKPEASPTDTVAGLAFLAGSWRGEIWGGVFDSYYTTPEGGRVLSFSELRRDGKVAFHEFERFDVVDGTPTLSPYPGGRPATPLALASMSADRAVFENPAKDFPTRIEYHRAAPDRLVITLTDPHGESGKREVFDLKRLKAG